MSEATALKRPLGEAYEQGRATILALVDGLDEVRASAPVPACPDWSVRDVVAHLTGVCSDISTGNVQPTPTVGWTAAQVAARSEKSLDEIVSEWEELGPSVAALIDDFPGRYGPQMVSDITVHEYDLRGALGDPGNRDSDRMSIALDFFVTILLNPSMNALGLGPLEIRTENENWIVGDNGPPAGALESAWVDAIIAGADSLPSGVAPEATLTAGRFDFFRAVSGRRSESQIRSFGWSVPPDPYLPLFGIGPFTVRPTDLVE